jgi:hypothetical protein
MNEIELLRELRADLPPIRPEARHAARASLNLRFEDAPRRAPRPRRPRWRRRRLRLALAGAALAAIAVAASIADLGGRAEVEPAAAQVLRDAADTASSQPPEPAPGPGQYFYTRSREAYLASVALSPSECGGEGACEASALTPNERETWTSPGGDGKFRTVSLEAEFLTAAQRRAWFSAGLPKPRGAGHVEEQSFKDEPILDTSKLPTDPPALRHLLEARKVPTVGGPPGEAETFVLIGDLLRNTYLPPDFRAALFEVAAELPKVESLGEVRDPIGRPGAAVSYTDNFTRHELIFDPETSALLGEREVSVRDGQFDAPAGTEIGSAAYLESGVVDSLGERPAGGGASGRRPSPAG